MTISNYRAGVIGLCLSLVILVFAIWRVFYQFCSKEVVVCRRRRGRETSCVCTHRRTFHVFFCVAMIVEALAYADLCDILPIGDERIGYILLELVGRSVLELLSYSVVTTLWLETIGKNRIGIAAQSALLCCVVFLVTSCVLQAVDILQLPMTTTSDDDTMSTTDEQQQQQQQQQQQEEERLWIYRFHLFVESLCWFLHGGAATACIIWTAAPIVRLSSEVFPQNWRQRIRLLGKALLPMILCCLCYLLRAVWLLVRLITNKRRIPNVERIHWSWWIGFEWIPTLIPSIMLLYSTRKRDMEIRNNNNMEDNNNSTPLLLHRNNNGSSNGPPVEAFVNFQRLDALMWSNDDSHNNNASLILDDDDDDESETMLPHSDEKKDKKRNFVAQFLFRGGKEEESNQEISSSIHKEEEIMVEGQQKQEESIITQT